MWNPASFPKNTIRELVFFLFNVNYIYKVSEVNECGDYNIIGVSLCTG